MQSIWWVARHIRWIRHPIMVPIAIVVAILAGAIPTIIADLVLSLGAPISKYVRNWVSRLSVSWLGDPWLWFLPIIFLLVWWIRQHGPSTYLSDSGDSPLGACPGKPLAKPPLPQVGRPIRKAELCDASLIWPHGGADKPLITDPCTQEAIFNIPLSDGDFFAHVVSASGDSHPNQLACPV